MMVSWQPVDRMRMSAVFLSIAYEQDRAGIEIIIHVQDAEEAVQGIFDDDTS